MANFCSLYITFHYIKSIIRTVIIVRVYCKIISSLFIRYSPVLMKPAVRFLAMGWYVIYLVIAIYGCLQLREGLEPVNLLVKDSYAIPHYRALENHFWHYGAAVQAVVNNPPDLRDPHERANIKEMVRAFANTKQTIGDNSVQFWLTEMELYHEKELKLPIVDQEFYVLGMAYVFIASINFSPALFGRKFRFVLARRR